MSAPILTPPELARASLEFWQHQAEKIADFRQACLASSHSDWCERLAPMHALAIRRAQQAREDWLKVCDQLRQRGPDTLDPHPGFWGGREDIK